MRIIKTTVLVMLGCAAIALAARPQTTSASEASTVAGNNTFALDLYGRLKTQEGNLFFSPYSISTCLAITYAGARGDTEAQIASTLHFDPDQAQLHLAFGELQSHLNAVEKKGNVDLSVANGLWGQKGHTFLGPFIGIAAKNYNAKLNQVDFRTSAEAARKGINDWVESRTSGRITDLIGPGVLDASTRLVLVNAIYFKGNWAQKFSENLTTALPFRVTTSNVSQAKFMHRTGSFKYAETDKLQLLELDYAGRDVSMVVLLPKQADGLKALENSLDEKQLDGWIAQAGSREVNVFLPKFKLTQAFTLSDTLAAMGMKDAFSPQANFSGIDGMRDLYISTVVHKAFVQVDEQGTEAAAATSVGFESLAIQRHAEPPVFRADHPFVFLLRDTHSGSILFLGRITNPAK